MRTQCRSRHLLVLMPALCLAAPAIPADTALYDRGLELCRSGRYEEARQSLQRFLETTPTSDIADNAYYWIGESYYAEGRYQEAASQFEIVCSRYSRENKAPDAWLKLGYCRQKLGDVAGALGALATALVKGTGTDVASRAKAKIEEIDAGAGPSAEPLAYGGRQAPAQSAEAHAEPSEPPAGAERAAEPAPVEVAAAEPAPPPPIYFPSDSPEPARLFVSKSVTLYGDDLWGFAVSPDGSAVFLYDNAKVNAATKERRVKSGKLVTLPGGAAVPSPPPDWFSAAVKMDVFDGAKEPSLRSYAPDGATYAYSKYFTRIRNVVIGQMDAKESVLGAGNLPFWLPDGRLLVVGYGQDGDDSLTKGLTLIELGVR